MYMNRKRNRKRRLAADPRGLNAEKKAFLAKYLLGMPPASSGPKREKVLLRLMLIIEEATMWAAVDLNMGYSYEQVTDLLAKIVEDRQNNSAASRERSIARQLPEWCKQIASDRVQ